MPNGSDPRIVRTGESLEAVLEGFGKMGKLDQVAGDNLEKLKNALAGVLSGDVDRYFRAFAVDSKIVEPESLFYGGEHKGIAACRALGNNVLSRIYERVDYEVLEMGAGGDRVFVHLHLTFVFRETGERLPMHVLEMWKFTNGEIEECWPFIFDVHALVERTKHLAEQYQDAMAPAE